MESMIRKARNKQIGYFTLLVLTVVVVAFFPDFVFGDLISFGVTLGIIVTSFYKAIKWNVIGEMAKDNSKPFKEVI